jgi:hypothetical protein
MLLHKSLQILRMSNHSELRDLRSEGLHFKNKYKFMILKSIMMPQIKEAFVWSQRKYKIYITISTLFCSDVSFIGTIYSRSWHLLFVLTLLISDLTFVLLLLSLLVSVQPDISKIFFRVMSENNCSHKNVLLIIEHIWRTNWITSGHETTVC